MKARILRMLLAIASVLAALAAQASLVKWHFDLGPDLPSPGPYSITDGSMDVIVDTTPTLVIDRANDRGWYYSQRQIIDAKVVLDGVEWAVASGVVSQTQCWDTDVFPNPGCSFDMDRFEFMLDFATGGYLEIGYLAHPESGLPGYPIWRDRPMEELTEPIALLSYGQGIRDPSAPDQGAFQLGVESWSVVPEPATLLLTALGFASIYWSKRKKT